MLHKTTEMKDTTSPTDPKNLKQSKTTSDLFLEDLIKSSKEDQVYKLASLFFTPEDIAFFVGLNSEEFKRRIKFSPEDGLVIAYRKGVMETEIKLRFDTHRYALSGSPEAINSMKDYLSKQKISEIE